MMYQNILVQINTANSLQNGSLILGLHLHGSWCLVVFRIISKINMWSNFLPLIGLILIYLQCEFKPCRANFLEDCVRLSFMLDLILLTHGFNNLSTHLCWWSFLYFAMAFFHYHFSSSSLSSSSSQWLLPTLLGSSSMFSQCRLHKYRPWLILVVPLSAWNQHRYVTADWKYKTFHPSYCSPSSNT